MMEPELVELPLTVLYPDSIRAWEQQMGVRNALTKLKAGLSEAIKYRGEDNRKAAGVSLEAVVEFLHTQSQLTEENLHRPLYDLLAALDDLDKGRIAPMLKATKFGNNPPRGAKFREAKGWTLFAVDQLVARGDNVASACRKVCEVWNKEVRREARTPETIRSWYKRSSRLPDDDPERVVLSSLRQAAEQDPRVQQIHILDNLAGALRAIEAPAAGE